MVVFFCDLKIFQMLKIPYSHLVHLNVLLLGSEIFSICEAQKSSPFVFFLPRFSFCLVSQAVFL